MYHFGYKNKYGVEYTTGQCCACYLNSELIWIQSSQNLHFHLIAIVSKGE